MQYLQSCLARSNSSGEVYIATVQVFETVYVKYDTRTYGWLPE